MTFLLMILMKTILMNKMLIKKTKERMRLVFIFVVSNDCKKTL